MSVNHKFAAAIALSAFAGSAQAISVTANSNATDLANAIAGSGITISNAMLTADTDNPSGTFVDGTASVGFDSGIVLTTGTTDCVSGPNNQGNCTGTGIGNFDSTSLRFDFVSDTGDVFFNYVFGSEEFTEFAPSEFNDAFRLLLDGVNIAFLPSALGVVEINNVNCLTNTAFYRNNVDGEPNQPASCLNQNLDIQYDGLTTVLTASGRVGAGTHSFEFLIFDRGDSDLDSGVFIRAGSFSATEPDPVPEPGTLALLGFGLAGLGLSRRRNSQATRSTRG